MEEEIGGCKRKYEEIVVEGRGPRVQESEGPGSKGPRSLKVIFKYELDSKVHLVSALEIIVLGRISSTFPQYFDNRIYAILQCIFWVHDLS